MAVGNASDFQVYDEEFQGGWTEMLMQNSDAFNEASRGAIRFVVEEKDGDYEREAFFSAVAAGNIINRRITTSNAAVVDQALTENEETRVKLNRRLGPISNTFDSFKKIGEDLSVFSFVLGQQMATALSRDMLNSTVRGADAALSGVAQLTLTTGATATHIALAQALEQFEDNSDAIVVWIMHSHVYFDLMQAGITAAITNVADVTIVDGTVATLGRPVVVTDSAAMVKAGSPNTYVTLGLTANALLANESEARSMETDVVTGEEQLRIRLQGEAAYNLGVKGFGWGGGANPTDAQVAAAGNWTQVAADTRSCAGVRLVTL